MFQCITIVFIALSILVIVSGIKIYLSITDPRKKKWKKDTAIVFYIGKGGRVPTTSPFSLKIMTFFRMANIPYETVAGRNFSSKGKVPWIMYNGNVVEDSDFILEYFNRKHGKIFSSKLSASEKAVGLAMKRMVEEYLYWTMCGATFDGDLAEISKLLPYSAPKTWLVTRLLRYVIKKQMWYHGIGRHDKKDYIQKGMECLQAISDWLEEKDFMMGSEPCEVDCAVFGMLAMCLWQMPNSPHERFIKGETKNLVSYCQRMKARFWPDWEDHVMKPEVKTD